MSTPSSPIGAAIMPVTPFQQNCTLVWCEATRQAAIIDPGGEVPLLLAEIEGRGLDLRKIWITHAHIDHAGGAQSLHEKTGAIIEGPHPADQFWIDDIAASAARWGMAEARPFTPNRWLADGDRVEVGELAFEVYHTPGHTPGHVIFFNRQARLAQVGDVLFKGAVGRWDFPQGDHAALIHSIVTRLWPLGDDVRFIPGHGPMSSFGAERGDNPYVADHVLNGAIETQR